MGISYVSVLSFTVCIISVFCCLFTASSSGTVFAVSHLLACIMAPFCVILTIFAKYHRKRKDLYGRKLEIYSIIISFFTCSYISDGNIVGFIFLLVSSLIYTKKIIFS